MTAPIWRGDPALIVYAARHALGRRGTHAPILVTQAIRANAIDLPDGARQALIRDVTAWLDGPGAVAAPADRQPWLLAVAALRAATSLCAQIPVPIPPQRRRTDRKATA